MNAKIIVVVYIEKKDVNAARKTLDSVFAQQMDDEIQVIVCDMMSIFEEAIYDYEEQDLIYIPIKEKMRRFELEMALREQIKSPYLAVIYDGEYFTDSKYLQRAVEFLEKETGFSMYGANAYVQDSREKSYDLTKTNNVLFDLQYRRWIIYDIADYLFNLDMEERTFGWLEAPMIVCRNDVLRKDIETILEQEELVQEIFTKRRGMNLLYLKKGMCLLENEVVACGWERKEVPEWKKYMRQSLEAYALQYYYEDKISPKRIWDQVHFAYVKGCRKLKQWEQQGNSYIVPRELQLLEFLTNKCEANIDVSPLWMQNYGNKNPDQVFMVLQLSNRAAGVFTTLFSFLGAVDYAEQNGAQALIDLKNAYMYGLQSIRERGQENAWEYYFRQPTERYTLDEVYQSKNVIKCDTFYWCNSSWKDMFPTDKASLNKWSELLRKHFRLTEELEQRCEKLYSEILKNKKRVLGVCVRNNYAKLDDTGAGLSHNHPRQPGINTFIADICKYMKLWECDYIYVLVDDGYVLQMIQKKFGEKCLTMNRSHIWQHKDGKPITDINEGVPKEWDMVENNKAYICDTWLLSKCTSLLSGNCSGGCMAYYWNDGAYEHVKVYEDGVY